MKIYQTTYYSKLFKQTDTVIVNTSEDQLRHCQRVCGQSAPWVQFTPHDFTYVERSAKANFSLMYR